MMIVKRSISRCLLIGGNGFLGRHLARHLSSVGREVTVLDKQPPCEILPPMATYVVGDFTDRILLERLVKEHDEVVHLAYASVPNTSFDDPLLDLDQNLYSTIKLFEVVACTGARLLFVSSGGTVYGEALSLPISEDHPTRPISPYGVTKLTLEKYAYLYSVSQGLDVVCVRPGNLFGEGQRPFLGQGFISTAMGLALDGRPIQIYGDTGSVRDYIHIDDVVAGMVTVLEKGKCGEVYNIGSTVGRSNLEVVEIMTPLLNQVGKKVRVEHLPLRSFDVRVNILDCRKIRALGWSPKVDFVEGLKRTLAWLRQ